MRTHLGLLSATCVLAVIAAPAWAQVIQPNGDKNNPGGPAMWCDLNLDGEVNAADLAVLQGNLGLTADASYATYAKGDLDCDGDIDGNDQAAMQAQIAYLSGQTSISGRYIFYNDSYYDGNKVGIDAEPLAGENNDDADAIDPSKSPLLLGGGKATFANWTGYSKGINGLIYDISQPTRDPVVSDFDFRNISHYGTSLPGTAVTPSGFQVQDLGNGNRRVLITFANDAVRNTWLQVTIGTGLGLPAADVHYWGNCRYDSGDPSSGVLVNDTDEISARNHNSGFARVPVSNFYDFDKSGRVDATDVIGVRNHPTGFCTCLQIITAPPGSATLKSDGIETCG